MKLLCLRERMVKEHLAVLRMKKNCTKSLEGRGLLRLLRHNSQDRALKLNDSKEKVCLGRML